MSGGVIVVAIVVAVFVILESLLPKALSSLWKWLRSAWTAKDDDDAPIATVAVASSTPAATQPPIPETAQAISIPVEKRTISAPVVTPLPPPSVAMPTPPPIKEERQEEKVKDEVKDETREQKAERLWNEAREIPHSFKPDWEKDRDYMEKIYEAARLGHVKAMMKLGEYASRRGALIESYYWMLLADLHGAEGLSVALRQARVAWMAQGCPNEHGNVYGLFSEEQGAFARSVLRLQCGIDAQYARTRLNDLSNQGVWEARLYMESRLRGGKR